MNFKKYILIFAAAALVQACGLYGKYKPETKAPEKLYGDVAYEAESFGRVSAKEIFDDPCLQMLIDSVLAKNTDMKASQLAIKQAEASLKAAKLGYLPSLSFNPTYSIDNALGSSFSIPVSASWQLDIFGRNTTAKRKANALTEEYKDLEQATKAELIASVAKAYYSLAMIDNQIKIADTTIRIREKALETQQALMDAGLSNSAAVSQFAAELCAVKVQQGELQRQFNEVRNSLSVLLNENLSDIQCGSMNATFPEIGNVEIASINLLSRPDVRAAQHDLEAAFYAERGAVAEFWPNIGISCNAGIHFDPTDFVWSVAGSLFQPLFQRGQLYANLKIAESQQEQAQIEFEKTLLVAATDISNALSGLNTAKNASTLYAEQEKHLVKYKGNNNLEGLENVLYECPECGKEFSIQVKDKSSLYCTEQQDCRPYQSRVMNAGYKNTFISYQKMR